MTEPSALRRLLSADRIVPVATIEDAETAVAVAEGLLAGGIGVIEVTLRTAAAWDAIDRIVAADLGIIVGAGTVIDEQQVDRAADAGARFVVSPGLDERVVARAGVRGVPALPGAATASEIQRALRAGCDVVKLFPAAQLGGVEAVRALSAPFSGMGFVPSGGVGPGNLREYFGTGAVPAVSGSWMLPADATRSGDTSAIARLTRAAVALLEDV